MNTGLPRVPSPPNGARYIRVGEKILRDDLVWDREASDWQTVPAELVDTELKREQFHTFCRPVV